MCMFVKYFRMTRITIKLMCTRVTGKITIIGKEKMQTDNTSKEALLRFREIEKNRSKEMCHSGEHSVPESLTNSSLA